MLKELLGDLSWIGVGFVLVLVVGSLFLGLVDGILRK